MEPRNPINPRFSIPLSLSRINWRAWLPSRGNVLFTLVVVFSLFWAQSANALPWIQPAATATSTGTWPYQGRLANSAGEPITNTISMIFRLYAAAGSGATPLWEEQWTGPNSVQVSDGLFNVMLGSLTPIPQSLVSENGSLWLGMTAGTDDEMTPRIQLGSVPFAVQALTVPDESITAAKLAAGSVTQAKLDAGVRAVPQDGSVTTAKLSDGAVTQAKAPSLVASANTTNARIYFGTETISVTSAQTTLSKTITISPACNNMQMFFQPHQNHYPDVVAFAGAPWTTDSFTATFFRTSGLGWTSGQIQNFAWLVICQ
jgi:hypothetical protein